MSAEAGDGARPEHVALAEEDLGVGVGDGLIFAGEVQVDIRHLVAVEAQEHLKGDIVPVLAQGLRRRPGSLVGQVTPGVGIGRYPTSKSEYRHWGQR